MNQLELHNKIDDLIKTGPSGDSFNVVSEVISVNEDAKSYFFAKADEKWLKWLWENGFLDVIKQKTENRDQFSYTLPELQYLVNIVEKDPSGVVDIMLQVPISEDNFNPEVVARFVWICGSLPAEQVARIVKKIRDDKWVKLMKKFNHFGFEYEHMLEKLFETGDWDNFLILSEAVLSIRSKDDISSKEKEYGTENPFYFNDLGQIKIFEYLVKIDDAHIEKALSLVSRVMKDIVLMQEKENKSSVFEVADSFGFYDVDFFTLELDDDKHLSYRDDVKNLAATLKKLTERVVDGRCLEADFVKKIYKNYINTLPFSRAMWHLRLYVFTLCPEVFKNELKDAFFKFFEYEKSYDLILGAEYGQALKKGFSVLADGDKRDFINKAINFFSKEGDDEKDKQWHKYKGRQILFCVFDHMKPEELEMAEKVLEGKLDKEYEPEPSIKHGMGGFVNSKAPITLEGLQKKSVPEIVKSLENEWTPEKLREMDTEKDFMNPLNADGMGMLLKADISQRFGLYVNNAEMFFNKDILDEHYTYSFLQGISDVLRQNKFEAESDLGKLLILMEKIIESDKKESFPQEERGRERFDSWVANWRAVYYSMADVIKELLGENKDRAIINFPDYRGRLLGIIKHLLSCYSPENKTNDEDYGSDPFSVAINSVRGRAFQSLVLFVYRDGDKFAKDKIIKIDDDVKDIYEKTLDKEDTFAIMFLYGHYLPTFYYRDKEWIKRLIVKIFTEDANKKDLYMAAWEGYISANIYGDMFNTGDFQKLYERAIKINPEDYTKRKYFRGLDEGLATHLALAYVHFPDFKIGSDLFELFWNAQNSKRHEEFVSFVGRHAISRDNASGFISENKIDLEKIKNLWDWVLEKVNDENVFSGFGFWVDKEQNVFDDSKWLADHIARTLERSKGETNWDYGLIKSLPILANKAPEETLKILRIYLLDQYTHKPDSFRNSVYVDDYLAAFKVVYGNKKTKDATYELINELIQKGSSRFWRLKEVIS